MTLKVLPLSKEREAWHDPPIPDTVFSKSYSFNSLVWGIFLIFLTYHHVQLSRRYWKYKVMSVPVWGD